jgi:TRAP-type C4-dicarboxylate transport system substrate-binding protein
MVTRRHVLASVLAQFPGGTIEKGDFRDRLCRMFAQEVAKRSGGEIAAEVYPNSSLIKINDNTVLAELSQ